MKKIKQLFAALACLLSPVRLIANALDHRAMLLKLLGVEDSAAEEMVNARYTEAMAEGGEEDKEAADKLKAANEAKTAADTLAANEKTARTTAEQRLADETKRANGEKELAGKLATSFANERKARVALLLDAAITANRITKAKRTEYETEFANEEKFDDAITKLASEKGTMLPGSRQAGMNGIGSRQIGVSPEAHKRREAIGNFVNEEMKKPMYGQKTPADRYSLAFTAVMGAHPELSEKQEA